MECLITLHLNLFPANQVGSSKGAIVMIGFEGTAEGEYFTGHTIGQCVDTQKYTPDGKGTLSARYMLEGVDHTGRSCKVFVENFGASLEDLHPTILTDSEALSFLQEIPLRSTVTVEPENRICVRIFRDNK